MDRLAESLHLRAVWFAYGLFYCLCGKTLYMWAFKAAMGLIWTDRIEDLSCSRTRERPK